MKNLLFILFLFFVSNAFTQENPDSLFSKARSLAERDNYKEAIVLADSLCKLYPGNRDYSTYLSRLYFWDGAPEKAKETLLALQTPEELTKEALDLLLQVELTLQSWNDVILHTNIGIKRFPDSKNHYLYQKALALGQLEENEEAIKVLEQIPKNDPDYKAADYLRTLILKKQKNTITAGYLLTTFDSKAFKAQQIGFIEYGRKFKANTHVFRLNYADMFGKNAFQFETDAYIKIKTLNYIYANLGISEKKSVFPHVRAGLEFYHERKQLSVSLGARYLYFDPSNNPLLVTGHFGYVSTGGWGINYRPFVSFLSTNKTLASHLVYLRKVFPKESYIQLDLQYGNLPYFYLTSDVLSRLKAYRAGINTRFRVKRNWFVQPVFMYEYEEYIPEKYRGRYTFQLILSHRF